MIREQQYNVEELKERKVGELAFSTYEIDHLAILPLLYQTGYLTIKSYSEETRLFELFYPNREVEDAFLAHLVGINFNSRKRAITEWKSETVGQY